LKNEVIHIKTINVPLIRKNSLCNTNNLPNPASNIKFRRKSQANYYNSPVLRFGSPVNNKKKTEISCMTPNSREISLISKEKDSSSYTSLKTPTNKSQNVISFNDVSLYKMNLIEFFRNEEVKESNKKVETPLKSIIKYPRKDSDGQKNSNKLPRPSVYLRFQDQIIEIPGIILNLQWYIISFIYYQRQTGFGGFSIKR
jgi:hypothetical protein